ncbi:MAG: hypothetical protein ABSC94_28945 [Polyangiaceae bacterium]|jgi:hypothetical protein
MTKRIGLATVLLAACASKATPFGVNDNAPTGQVVAAASIAEDAGDVTDAGTVNVLDVAPLLPTVDASGEAGPAPVASEAGLEAATVPMAADGGELDVTAAPPSADGASDAACTQRVSFCTGASLEAGDCVGIYAACTLTSSMTDPADNNPGTYFVWCCP